MLVGRWRVVSGWLLMAVGVVAVEWWVLGSLLMSVGVAVGLIVVLAAYCCRIDVEGVWLVDCVFWW